MSKAKIQTALAFLVALFFLAQGIVLANPGGGNLPVASLTTEWQLEREIDGIQIYACRIECHDYMNGIFTENVLLKFVNTTGQDVRIDWGMELWYDGKCLTCHKTDTEYHYLVDVDAGSSYEGTCDQQSPPTVKIFLRFLNYEHVAKLTQYNMAHLRVSPR